MPYKKFNPLLGPSMMKTVKEPTILKVDATMMKTSLETSQRSITPKTAIMYSRMKPKSTEQSKIGLTVKSYLKTQPKSPEASKLAPKATGQQSIALKEGPMKWSDPNVKETDLKVENFLNGSAMNLPSLSTSVTRPSAGKQGEYETLNPEELKDKDQKTKGKVDSKKKEKGPKRPPPEIDDPIITKKFETPRPPEPDPPLPDEKHSSDRESHRVPPPEEWMTPEQIRESPYELMEWEIQGRKTPYCRYKIRKYGPPKPKKKRKRSKGLLSRIRRNPCFYTFVGIIVVLFAVLFAVSIKILVSGAEATAIQHVLASKVAISTGTDEFESEAEKFYRHASLRRLPNSGPESCFQPHTGDGPPSNRKTESDQTNSSCLSSIKARRQSINVQDRAASDDERSPIMIDGIEGNQG